MRIQLRVIAILLAIIMMFSMLPTEILSLVSPNAFADVLGTSNTNISIGSTLPGKKGGAVYLDYPVFRVSLSRQADTYLNGTAIAREEVERAHSYKYPTLSKGQDVLNDTLFFMANTIYNLNNKGYSYYTNNPSVGLQRITGTDITKRFVNRSYPTPSSSAPVNRFKVNVQNKYNSKEIDNTYDLANNVWRQYLPSLDEAKAIMNYILNINYKNTSSGTDAINQRIVNVVDPNFNVERDTLTYKQQFDVAVGYGGLLASLYVIAGNQGATEVAESYAIALNDYFANNDLRTKPVTLVIDTCMTYTQAGGGYNITPSIDLVEYILATGVDYSITTGDTFLRTQKGGVTSTTKEMIEEMAKKSLEVYPYDTTKGYTNGSNRGEEKQILRTTDINRIPGGSWGNTLNNTAIGWAIKVFQLRENTIWTTASGAKWGSNDLQGYLSLFNLTNDIKGYVMIGNHMSNPKPTAKYSVKDDVKATEDTCETTVYITTPSEITVRIGEHSEFTSYLEGLRNSGETVIVESSITRLEGKQALIGDLNSIDDPSKKAVGGFVSDGGTINEEMLLLQQQIDGEYTIGEFLEHASSCFILRDYSLLDTSKHSYERESASYNVTFTYIINLRISIGKIQYELKYEDICEKAENVPKNFASFNILAYKENAKDYKNMDIEIVAPDDVDTTEIVNPSKNENKYNINGSEGHEITDVDAVNAKEADRPTAYMVHRYTYASAIGSMETGKSVGAFAEVKSNEPLQEEYEVMGGIPSTEELYLSFGGAEYKVALVLKYWINEHSRDRTYTIHFEGNDCEYNNDEEGKGDTWPGGDPSGTKGKTKIPTAQGPSSSDYTLNHNNDLEISCTWTGSIPFNGTPWATSGTCGYVGSNSWDWSAYNTALSQAQAWESAIGATTITWTSASDKATRKYILQPTHTSDQHWSTGSSECPSNGSPGSGKNCVSSCSGHGEGQSCPGHFCSHTPSSVVSATDGSYTITVKATIKPHMICGPCCGHKMPDLWDTWRQGLVFDYAEIAQIRLFLLNQGSAEGFTELTGTDRIVANVVSGNPTYFMNIAQLNMLGDTSSWQNKVYMHDYYHPGESMGVNNFKEFYAQSNNSNKTILGPGESRREAQSSRAGRLRYLLDPKNKKTETFNYTEQGNGSNGSFVLDYTKVANTKQHDDVFYTVGKRTKNCDGMATTNNFGKSSSNNVKPMEKTGHQNEWADGCLYTNIMNNATTNFSNYWSDSSFGYTYQPKELKANDENILKYYEDYNHHIVRDSSLVKTGYSDKADNKDTQTPEWKVFNAARRTKIIVDVISDFLIMQTSGGDQSIFYFEKVSKPTEAQEHFQKVKATEEEMFTENPLSIFNAAYTGVCPNDPSIGATLKDGIVGFEVIGGYNGRYDVPSKKYMPYSLITNNFLSFGGTDGNNWKKYNASYNTSDYQTKIGGNYTSYGETKVVTIFDDDPAGTINRPQRQATGQNNSFKIYQDNIQILPTAPNKLYSFDGACVWYSQVFGYFAVQNTNVYDMEHNLNKSLSTANVNIGHPQLTLYKDEYKSYWGDKVGVQFATRYYNTEDGDSDINTINDVIVFTPVSTEDALVLPQGDLNLNGTTVSRDQRVNGFDFPDMNKVVNDLKVCSLDPASCEYRYLDCKYLEDTKKASFNFNTYTYKNGKYYVKDQMSGAEFALPSGFYISSNSAFSGSYFLRGSGTSSWALPLSELGISTSKSTRLKVSMKIRTDATSGKVMVAGFKNLGFVIDLDSYYNNGFIVAGAQKRNNVWPINTSKCFYNSSFRNSSGIKLDIIFGLNNIVDCTASINGVPVTSYTVKDYRNQWQSVYSNGTYVRKQVTTDVVLSATDLNNNPPANFTTGDILSTLYIGNWSNGHSTYQSNFYIDDLEIWQMGGTHDHTSACYRTITTHTNKKIHVHNDSCYLKEDTYICDGALNYYGAVTCGKTDAYTCGLTESGTGTYSMLVSNDDGGGSHSELGCKGLDAYISYNLKAGDTVKIQMGGYKGGSGYATLHIAGPTGSFTFNSGKQEYSGYFTGENSYKYEYAVLVTGTYVFYTTDYSGDPYLGLYKMDGHRHFPTCKHTHTGSPGDTANGCYTRPTEHRHNLQKLTCGLTEGGSSSVYNFEYTGNVQSVTLNPGQYKLEVWGASGGDSFAVDGSGWMDSFYNGGKGGYSSGTFKVTTPITVYVVVGGQGNGAAGDELSTILPTSRNSNGGYNGGGSGMYFNSSIAGRTVRLIGGGGGGATHIATQTGLLNTLSTKKDSVLLVAGGGGGAGGGSGQYAIGLGSSSTTPSNILDGGSGGLVEYENKGIDAKVYYSSSLSTETGLRESTTNTSSTSGVFGLGGNGAISTGYCRSSSNYYIWGALQSGGGGGGYYGGGGGGAGYISGKGTTTYDYFYAGVGGGGSGYANTTKLSSTSLKAGYSSFVSFTGTNETGHKGNGYARITSIVHTHTSSCYEATTSCEKLPKGSLFCNNEPNTITDYNVHKHTTSCLTSNTKLNLYNFSYTGKTQVFTVPYTDNYKIECFGVGVNNITGYTSGVVKLTSGSKLYVYVGSLGYNLGASDVRLTTIVPESPGMSQQEKTELQQRNANSANTRLMSAGKTRSASFVSTNVSGYTINNRVVGTKGGTSYGRVIITPLNELPARTGSTVLDDIVNNKYSKDMVKKYLGEELANMILNENVGVTTNYYYTGTSQTITLSPGSYDLVVFGAKGGENGNTGEGGEGGFAGGTLSLSSTTTLTYILGGKGEGSSVTTWWTNQGKGGFNGGGDPGRDTDSNDNNRNEMGGGGGGYSTVKIGTTAILTAGGGGGRTYYNSPGARATGGAGGGSYNSQGKAGVLADSGGQAIGGVCGKDGVTIRATGWYNSSYITNGRKGEAINTGNGVLRIKPLNSVSANAKTIILNNISKIPDYVDGDLNPIFGCKFQGYNAHDCNIGNCKTYRILECNEPHHKGTYIDANGKEQFIEHYSGANRVCWSACGNNDNHKNTKTSVVVDTGNGETKNLQLAEFLQLDEGFTVYFPNRGDFRGNNVLGLSRPQIDRGYGYSDNMNTTQWTREKRVKFPFDVLFEEKNGEIKFYSADTWIVLDVPTEYFNFYLLVENPEMPNGSVEFEVEAINCGTVAGVKPTRNTSYTSTVSNGYRNALTTFVNSYFSTFKQTYLSTGYQTYSIGANGNNNNGGAGRRVAFNNLGYMNFYSRIAKNGDKGSVLSNSMATVDSQIERDFEGLSGADDYIDPHRNKGTSGINNTLRPITNNDNKVRVNNRMRTDSYQSLHGGYKHFYLDVIGRIGNFAITDTEDFRFSNFFKVPVSEGLENPNNWLVEGLLKKVNPDIQNYYIGDTFDIRGNKAASENRWLDTYGTQSWMAGVLKAGKRDVNDPNLVSQILTGNVNNVDVLKKEELRYGYDVFTSIVTMGSYNNGLVQVIPKYYALKVSNNTSGDVPAKYNVAIGTYVPIDVYISKDGVYKPVNIFENAESGDANKGNVEMSDYVFNLNWDTESDRRNYTMEEAARTKRIQEHYKQIIYDYSKYGDKLEGDNLKEFDVTGLPILKVVEYTIPNGKDNYIGSAQYSLLNSNHRTFIGNTKTYGTGKGSKLGHTLWNGVDFGIEKNNYSVAYKDAQKPTSFDYEQAVQRWHGKIGLPSSAVYVPHGEEVNVQTLKYLMEENRENWVVVCTAEIIAIGSVWNVAYSQPWFTKMTINNEVYNTNLLNSNTTQHYPGHRIYQGGKSVLCPYCIDPIIAVFENSSVDDVEIIDIY